ncbi:hypothetical protein N182_36430 [Sinorhizobium sp. GL2]|nr:hypothetical protein N182_36430 [Sinorhizobium sp. GL2]
MNDAFKTHCLKQTVARLRRGITIEKNETIGRHCLRAINLKFPLPADEGVLEFLTCLGNGICLQDLLNQVAEPAAASLVSVFNGILIRGFVEYEVFYAPGEYVRVVPNAGGYVPEFTSDPTGFKYAVADEAFLKRAETDWVALAPKCKADLWFPFSSGFEILASLANGGILRPKTMEHAVLYALMASLGLITRPGTEIEQQTGLQFHELLFHRFSRKADHGRVSGAVFPGLSEGRENPFLQRRWDCGVISLPETQPAEKPYGRSIREFSDAPITVHQLGRLLSMTAMATGCTGYLIDGRPVDVLQRPYPSGGGLYEIEVYLAAYRVDGVDQGFFHYDPSNHSLACVSRDHHKLRRLATISRTAMGVDSDPPLVLVLSARFERLTWKYRSLTYSVILKNVGVLMKTIYDALPTCGLGGCALGSGNIDLFEELTGLDWHEESSVGEFVIGVPRA